MNNKIKKAIFPVAGLGTRFLPATKCVPKEMLTVLDKPVIEWAVTEAHEAGIEQIIFVSSTKKNLLLEHFDRSNLLEDSLLKKKKYKEIESIKIQTQLGEVVTVIQHEPKGLGHAIWCARNLVENEKFAVILPDDIIRSKKPVIRQMIDLEKKLNGSIIAVEEVEKNETHKYGIVDIKKKKDDYFVLKDIVEKPNPKDAPTNLSVIGRYILDPKIFTYLNKQKIGFGGEIQLTDAIQYLIHKEKVFGYKFKGQRYDCGSKLGFIKANLGFGFNDKEIKDDLLKFVKNI